MPSLTDLTLHPWDQAVYEKPEKPRQFPVVRDGKAVGR